MNQGKCPNNACGQVLQNLVIEAVSLKDGPRNWKGASFVCPACKTIISASIDPIALRAELIQEIRKALGR